MKDSTIHVFAGVNGSGKSSILGEPIKSAGGSFFNPDTFTRELMAADPSLTLEEAQSTAWSFGRDSLEDAIATGRNFAFETTLGVPMTPSRPQAKINARADHLRRHDRADTRARQPEAGLIAGTGDASCRPDEHTVASDSA